MSVLYATPAYVGISMIMCLSYSCIECTKDKGSLTNTNKSLLIGWVITSLIIASTIAGVTGEMMIGMTNITHLIIVGILVCATLSISSLMIYWS